MSRTKNQSPRNPMAGAVLAVLVLATGAWAAISHTSSFSLSPAAASLEAPIPPAEGVFIQQRDGSDGLGNAFLRVQLSPAQIRAKQQDGTADFLTIGAGETTVILRDDGVGGDEEAGDGLYTGIADVDPEELEARAALDEEELANNPGRDVAVFEGRSATGIVRPTAFDFNGFAGEAQVALVPRTFFPLDEGPAPPPITSTNPVTPGTNSFQEQVLMITSTDVVTDPARVWNPCTNYGNASGVWTFNHLITGIANNPLTGYDPADLVEDWLGTWLSPQTIKNDLVPARPVMQHILDQWPRLPGGRLDLEKSPLRLLAIVPRVDLRNGTGGGYSGGGGFKNGGELRFIFSFVAKETSTFDPHVFKGVEKINNSSCYALPFNVIFEYRVPKTTCEDVKNWAHRWVALKNWTPGPGPYNNALEILTEEVVSAGITDGANGSALSQLRTNEVALDTPWELREFRLQNPTSFLTPSPVSDTPRGDLNNRAYDPNDPTSTLLRDWILLKAKPALDLANNNEAAIPAVTDKYLGKDFIGGAAHTLSAPNLIEFFWKVPDPGLPSVPKVDVLNLVVRDNWARHRVSRNTCNGCHSRETFTQFVHVNSAKTITISGTSDPALPAELSVFLTGINGLGDPANAEASSAAPSNPTAGLPKRNFDDLARREQDINNVDKMSCSGMGVVNRVRVLKSLAETGKLPVDLFEGAASERLSVAIDDIKRNVISEVH